MKNTIEFDKLPPVDDIKGLVFDIFGVDVDISGGWGYDNKTALMVHSQKVPSEQFAFMFASMRANIEMNLALEEEDRFGAINVNQEDFEIQSFEIENKIYDVYTYKINAIKENIYADFIQEYKDNYGKNPDFDMDDHFKRREKSTISLVADFWFEGLGDNIQIDEGSNEISG
jgi:hypothetical protein